MTMTKLAIITSTALLLAACGGSDDVGQTQKSLCEEETRGDTYVAGLEKSSDGGMFTARLVEGTPAPPDRGDNTWTLEIMDASGSPMTDADQVRVKAWMPDHGHGTNPLWNEATSLSGATYEVGPFDIFMGGFWQFTVEVERQGTTDEALYGFCIEG